MLFFAARKVIESTQSTEPAAPKRPSILGTMFNPRIGDSLRPLGETTSVFVQLIAMVFAMNGLFPKNHPALLGVEGARLNLSEIFGTAWNSLSFTKEGLPKVILFFAVTGTMIFSVLSVITALLAGFMGTAHADTGGNASMFSAMGPDDLAQNWIDYLFKGHPLSDFYGLSSGSAPNTLGQANDLQCAMITALGFYSNAMLCFAAVILFYHLVSMVVNTAHEGVAMGKRANQIWAPVRLVFAIGLLVPIGSGSTACNTTTGAGLNAGQYIVIQMAEWGSGLASQTWSIFLGSLAKQYSYVPPPTPNVEALVEKMAVLEACRYAFNYQLWQVNNSGPVSDDYIGGAFDPTNYSAPILNSQPSKDGMRWYYGNNIIDDNAVCGSYILKTPSASNNASFGSHKAVNIVKAYNDAFVNELPKFATLGSKISYFIPEHPNGEGQSPSPLDYQNEVTSFQDSMKRALDAQMQDLSDSSLASDVQKWSGYGWVTAGAWVNTIARIQGDIFAASTDGIPVVVLPASRLDENVALPLANFESWQLLHISSPSSTPAAPALSDPCGGAQQTATQGMKNDTKWDDDHQSMIEEVLQRVDAAAANSGLWSTTDGCPANNGNPSFSLGMQLKTSNPLAEIANFGHQSVLVAYGLIDGPKGIYQKSLDIALNELKWENARFGKDPPVDRIARELYKLKIAAWHVNIDTMFALIFFSCGYVLAFVVPLLPFFRFFFNILTWIVSLLEAIVAVPLIALGHLNPEGEGLPSQSAKAAYFMIFNIFLRPVMTVFGLIAGLLVFIIAIIFLNATYGLAVASTGSTMHGHTTFIRIIYTLMYGATVYSCANNCFKTIGAFPENALRWIGQQAHHERMGDGGRAVQAVMGQAQTYGGQKALDIAKVTRGSGGGV